MDPSLWDSTLSFFINGVQVSVANPDPNMHLVDYLRDVAMLKATKVWVSPGERAHQVYLLPPMPALLPSDWLF